MLISLHDLFLTTQAVQGKLGEFRVEPALAPEPALSAQTAVLQNRLVRVPKMGYASAGAEGAHGEHELSQNQLAQAVGISPNRIAEIVNNRRRITADTALRLSVYFDNTPEYWMNLQAHYDLKVARRGLSLQERRRIRARRAA